MGSSNSKPEKDGALHLCGERMRFIRQAIEARYALSAAHLAYIQSLRNIGTALRQFAEAEISTESSLSTSERDKSPSHSFYASPSPSHIVDKAGSPTCTSGTMSPLFSNLSYMKSVGTSALTVKVDSSLSHLADDESLPFPIQPPPPPPGIGSTWDFFDPSDSAENIKSHFDPKFSNSVVLRKFREEEVVPLDELNMKSDKVHPVVNGKEGALNANRTDVSNSDALANNAVSQEGTSNIEKAELEKELLTEREDPSEFITHRAKDFLSSMRDIENRFLRAAESGNEVSRMLEANKIRLGSFLEANGRTSATTCLSDIRVPCCKRGGVVAHEPAQNVTKVITWTRSVSSLSSSSRNPLASASKDDACDSSSDFVEEFCMISGSHSSTLDRLYAWERKLYDEVKASESIRKLYDRKCWQLRSQCARDMKAKVIDKSRAIVKDLHSQVQVSIISVDSISKRIEKLRDNELLPQCVELIQGLIRMWKAMLECHHMQYITISLAYHAKISTAVQQTEAYSTILANLQDEIDTFNSSFVMWVDAHGAYVEAINSWLQNCILQPQERSRGRKLTFSPRSAIAPPIFVLCRDWLAGIRSLPSEALSNAIKGTVLELRGCSVQLIEEKQTEKGPKELSNRGSSNNEDEKCEKVTHLSSLQASLTKIFDNLSKFAAASLRNYEEIREASEKARIAYVRGRMRFLT